MPQVRYVGNVDPTSGNQKIKLGNDENGQPRFLHLGGEALELADKEIAKLKRFFHLEVNNASAPTQTVQPAQQPVAPVAQPQTIPTPSTPSVTPVQPGR